MTFVSSLKYEDGLTTAQKQRVVSGMQRLRECFHAKGEPPLRTMDDTVIIATWNLREFGKSKFGYRGPEPYYYIASIIDRFDLVALQEIRSLYALQHLCGLLGSHWNYLITDVTLGPGGNAERMAYLYDNRKVRFSGLAAELVLLHRLTTSPTSSAASSAPRATSVKNGLVRSVTSRPISRLRPTLSARADSFRT